MSEISRAVLFGKLDTLLFTSLESATAFCKLRGNPYVELVHWLHQLMQQENGDLQQVIRHFALDEQALTRDIIAALDALPRGAGSVSDLSEHIDSAVERAWVYGSLKYGVGRIRGGHLLIGLLKTWNLASVLKGISAQFGRINVEALSEQFDTLLADSKESQQAAAEPTEQGAVPAAKGTLAQYGQNLTERARDGKIDPVVGRDEEIRQMVDILMRRRQNNPLLTGEAGVGKTAVVEGLALRIAAGDVPEPLRDIQLWLLDIGMLQAGAGMKGEFEARLQALINEVQASPTPIVLFIDEIHTLIGAGGQQGTGDAANLLKPALARGQLRTVGATTWAEYKKYIEKDPALTRRFQTVQIHEPDEEKALLMLRSTVSPLEKHHRVLLLDEAVSAAVKLSHRYIPARQLPDKAVALLDTACARVAVSQGATPPRLEDLQHRIAGLDVEIEIARRESRVGIGDSQRPAQLLAERERLEAERDALTLRWEEERRLVDATIALRAQLHDADEAALPELRAELESTQEALKAVQGDAPLLFAAVDENVVAAVVSDWTGIPLGRMVKNEIDAVLSLADTLNQRVIGQRHGLDLIAKRVRTSRARLDDPNKPVGVFMLCGPSGVGKTETALALAESLYGGEQNVITINMSEFQEAHTVSTLKGAPPGYVGYGEGGVLTEAVRRRPYSVVLLDEIEKAHPDVHEIFFQVFDKGWMEDGEGRHIDFRNTIIILTSNVGTDLISAMCADPELMPEPEALGTALRQPLLQVFPPALLGRLLVVPYYPLSDEMLGQIVRLQLARIQRRLKENHNILSDIDDSVVDQVVRRCTEVESGGRMVDAILTNTLLPQISQILLTASRNDEQFRHLRVSFADGEFHCQFAA
ncbi:type VI secretion system ATPase TssH [Pluralibacter gergoviae]|uniref:Type VI secretion system ATPase TssH n=1 Tax=Pluralibacter gergoviae TaxID=61647 RepID=A0AAI9DP37_PLUGE|nr:type VI secretion system ATPase TssH [Pluralibacter gergoviae]EKV0916982.1 type VI secretion system ATPase TssH [Pluralibacter gergoviae]EKV9910916.1 type VI secretion system ATPase TssH [Pluralibacter gergoviae]EKW7277025.1 type VI secretion system ATPase TssH [Pluralibacter gergoviae]ELD4297499.1 type VI secretion system ATPase TssH [Pluralibacter gergoviae]ELD4308246.1 type VI secretion system ATPase TssH [Pluralibacter gergoviae]